MPGFDEALSADRNGSSIFAVGTWGGVSAWLEVAAGLIEAAGGMATVGAVEAAGEGSASLGSGALSSCKKVASAAAPVATATSPIVARRQNRVLTAMRFVRIPSTAAKQHARTAQLRRVHANSWARADSATRANQLTECG